MTLKKQDLTKYLEEEYMKQKVNVIKYKYIDKWINNKELDLKAPAAT